MSKQATHRKKKNTEIHGGKCDRLRPKFHSFGSKLHSDTALNLKMPSSGRFLWCMLLWFLWILPLCDSTPKVSSRWFCLHCPVHRQLSRARVRVGVLHCKTCEATKKRKKRLQRHGGDRKSVIFSGKRKHDDDAAAGPLGFLGYYSERDRMEMRKKTGALVLSTDPVCKRLKLLQNDRNVHAGTKELFAAVKDADFRVAHRTILAVRLLSSPHNQAGRLRDAALQGPAAFATAVRATPAGHWVYRMRVTKVAVSQSIESAARCIDRRREQHDPWGDLTHCATDLTKCFVRKGGRKPTFACGEVAKDLVQLYGSDIISKDTRPIEGEGMKRGLRKLRRDNGFEEATLSSLAATLRSSEIAIETALCEYDKYSRYYQRLVRCKWVWSKAVPRRLQYVPKTVIAAGGA